MVDTGLDEELLDAARRARDRLLKLQHRADQARVAYQHEIRRLYAHGGSMRDIANALGLSYQRVHQMVDLSTGKGPIKPRAGEGCCSFCGARPDARQMLAGPGVCICKGCIDLALQVMLESRPRANATAAMAPLGPGSGKARCSFCGRKRSQAQPMACMPHARDPAPAAWKRLDTGVRICQDCVRLAGDMAARRAPT